VATLFGEPERYPTGLEDLGRGVHAWLQPNGSWGESNAGLVVGDGASVLVDTLWDLVLAREMLHAMAPIAASAPITHVVNTHADGDHWFGNAAVDGAQVIASRAATDEMAEVTPGQFRSFARLGRALSLAGRWPLPYPRRADAKRLGRYVTRMLEPYDFDGVELRPPTQSFSDTLLLEVGGRELELIEVGPAHTRGDALVHVPDARTAFSGDVLFVESTPVMWAGPVENWVAALDRLLGLDVDTIVPGHGPVTDKDGVRRVRAYWEFLEPAARARFDAGLGPVDAAKEVALGGEFGRTEFAGWDSPERIVINVRTLYLGFEGKPTEAGVRELLSVFRDTAALAVQLPEATPARLHRL
jgi:cyclase